MRASREGDGGFIWGRADMHPSLGRRPPSASTPTCEIAVSFNWCGASRDDDSRARACDPPAMRTFIAVVIVCLASVARPPDDAPLGKLHPDPGVPDARFKPHQMPFELPNDGVARAEISSERFFAVL